jgi:hypothetical protein
MVAAVAVAVAAVVGEALAVLVPEEDLVPVQEVLAELAVPESAPEQVPVRQQAELVVGGVAMVWEILMPVHTVRLIGTGSGAIGLGAAAAMVREILTPHTVGIIRAG